jgi:Raf kinase inhibitor-like YbhB/YbcL family protein
MRAWSAAVLLLLVVVASLTGCREGTVDSLTVTSPAFEAGGKIPAVYTCDGESTSPPLAWNTPPEGTMSLALIMDDPDAHGFVHWVVYDLPASTRELPEAIPPESPTAAGGFQGRGNRNLGYFGPCPPEQDPPHHYSIRVYALDSKLDLEAGANKSEVERAMEGKVLAMGELMAVYGRK